jgi:hypothetical protein
MRHLTLCALLVVLASGRSAHAGRTHFGWLYGSELVPENGTEVETWIVEENKKGSNERDETSFWWGPVFAVTQHLELAIPIEAAYANEHDGSTDLVHFTRWGAEFRYRPQSPDPIDAGPVATLFRAGAKRLIEDRAAVRFEADLVVSVNSGRVFALIDLGAITQRVPGANESEVRPGAGVSVRVVGDLRLGVESYGELIVEGEGTSWLVVGPSVSLTSGRFWGAATLGVGLFGLRDAPRLTFGVAL